MLSDDVLEHILNYLSTKSTKELSIQFKRVSFSYRHNECKNTGLTKADVDAYLVGRLPLTFSVLCDLLEKIKVHMPFTFSVTDYGSGPATALLALHYVFDNSCFQYLAVEEKTAMKEAAVYLADKLNYQMQIRQMNVEKAEGLFSTLAIASYLLNELENMESFFKILCNHHEFILVIEPGTPDGYQRILKLRDLALKNGFSVVAPCPHGNPCPLQEGDWCHFFTRCQRPKILKQIKEASLGYEDEKYSYIFLSKHTKASHNGVLLDKPLVHPYKIEMKACCQDGHLKLLEIPKKDKDAYKMAKKSAWGDFI
jgi:ribosomal protein RSM22 (predicted rRNA methylase)